MTGSTKIGVAVGVIIGLAAALYGFGRILGLAEDGTDDSAFVWTAIVAAPMLSCIVGFGAGRFVAFTLRHFAR